MHCCTRQGLSNIICVLNLPKRKLPDWTGLSSRGTGTWRIRMDPWQVARSWRFHTTETEPQSNGKLIDPASLKHDSQCIATSTQFTSAKNQNLGWDRQVSRKIDVSVEGFIRFPVLLCRCDRARGMAGPEGFEPPTTWFEARYSIQLSYGPAYEL